MIAGRRTRRILMGVLATALIATTAACTSSGDSNGAASPGVTDDAVRVGYQIVDLGALSATLGITGIDQGSYETRVKAVQAIIDYVNANGGLGGRTLEPSIQQYAGPQDAPAYAEAQCRALTQDVKVFAVAMDGQFQNNVRPCFKGANTMMLDQTLLAQDTQSFNEYAPYLWAPTVPEYSSFITTQIDVLQQSGFLNGSNGVSVIAPDTEVTRRIVDTVVLPKLKGLGLTNSAAQYIDSSNIGTLGAGASAALQATQIAGLNRVMVVGGARIEPILFSDVLFSQLNAVFTISSFDNPAYFIDNTNSFDASKRAGMAGLGYMPALDLRKSTTEPFPDPARPNEGLCKQIIDQAGAAPPQPYRENYRTMMQFCDSTFLLKAAFDKLPKGTTVSAEGFRDAVWSVGAGWTAATVPNPNGWPANAYSGVVSGRGMYFNQQCQVEGAATPGCFVYGTPDTPLTPQSASGVAPSAPAPATQ